MIPILAKFGPITVYSYGLMLAIAVVVCAWLAGREAKKEGVSVDFVYDFLFWVVVGGILGARILYITVHLDYFLDRPQDIIRIHTGGLSWQGGFIFGTIFGISFVKLKKMSVVKMADFFAPYVALGQSIGRLGCFLNGCCFGIPAQWGIFFPVHQEHLHPTQLYSTLGLFLIYLTLIKLRSRNLAQGTIFVLYVLFAASWRFCVEFFRADHEVFYFGLSIYQTICIGLIITALYVYSRLKSRRA